jgi:dienelactone hydrolase
VAVRPLDGKNIVLASKLMPMKTLRHSFPALWIALWLGQPAVGVRGQVFQTSVAPQPDEDLASACRYELTLPNPTRPVRGVWVIFDRGRDMLRYYGDADVHAFAKRHDWAVLLSFHCRAQSGTDGDMNMDPSRGLGRALLSAFTQFANLSGHPELASVKLILLGFSGTGSLAGRFAEYAPDRVVAVIAAHAGHNPLGLDTIELSVKATAIPQLIVAGSTDRITGTERPYLYFRKYFDRGAPWTFVVQNRTPHCCVINARAVGGLVADSRIREAVALVRDAKRASGHVAAALAKRPGETDAIIHGRRRRGQTTGPQRIPVGPWSDAPTLR